MKNITAAQLQLTNMKFEDIFDNIEESHEALKIIDDKIINNRLKGYEFLNSFKKQLLSGKKLSDKQNIQIKRLCKEIAKGYLIQIKQFD